MIGFTSTSTSFSPFLLGSLQNIANEKYITTTESTALTTWGFQDFSIPAETVNLSGGANIQAAINGLASGGTINLGAGTYTVAKLQLRSDIVIQGAGEGSTIITFNGAQFEPVIQARADSAPTGNIILRNMTIDCSGTLDANGVEFIFGVTNILCENLTIFNAHKGNLVIFGTTYSNRAHRATFRNITSYNPALYHAIGITFCEGAIVENCEMYNSGGYGLDAHSCFHLEVVNSYIHDNTWGTKFPASNWVFLHDTLIQNSPDVGIKFNKTAVDNPYPSAHFHIENVVVDNCVQGVVDWGDTEVAPTFTEFTTKDNAIINCNYNNSIRLRGCLDGHEFGNNIGYLQQRATGTGDTTVYVTTHTSGTPAEFSVGYTTWGNPA